MDEQGDALAIDKALLAEEVEEAEEVDGHELEQKAGQGDTTSRRVHP